ncbi:MAG TPA: phosphatidate cytidylyltransferase [Alphaproteobacteria bacterium]
MTDPTLSASTGDLGKRIASGIVMALLAVGAVVLGGWPFALFWAAAAIGIFWEWSAIVAGGAIAARTVGVAALTAAALAVGAGQIYAAAMALAAGVAAVAAACAPGRRGWGAAGVAYAGIVLIAPMVLRRDRELGLLAMLFLFAVVWSTDILGYFVGRAIGGPRLAPPISPKKTWSGAGGGALGAIVAGLAVVHIAGDIALLPATCVAFVLSIASQAGDLFESAVKRRFGVKDASHLIPGHGGLMDRLDGFIAASGVAALVGIMRGGLDASARGLLLW